MAPKRHHYIPEVYLKRFSGEDGKVVCLHTDFPVRTTRQVPKELGHHKYYYSQPLPHGLKNDTLETVFSITENKFERVMGKIVRHRALSDDDFSDLVEFILLMRVRVPAMRESVELFLGEVVRETGRSLEMRGLIDTHPTLGNQIWDSMQITVDPHRSIHAMIPLINGMGRLIDSLGFVIARNKSNVRFVTSDNPVIYFDPTETERPYIQATSNDIVLVFPLSADFALYGASCLRDEFLDRDSICYREFHDDQFARTINRMIVKYGYRQIYGVNPEDLNTYIPYSSTSPILSICRGFGSTETLLRSEWIFGTRPSIAKWKRRPGLYPSTERV
jgi:Protein of unknown function (DUF4238)